MFSNNKNKGIRSIIHANYHIYEKAIEDLRNLEDININDLILFEMIIQQGGIICILQLRDFFFDADCIDFLMLNREMACELYVIIKIIIDYMTSS